MATFQWNSPTPAAATPPCYGQSRFYDPSSRECRQCNYSNGCREKIDASRFAAPPIVGPPAFQPQFNQPPQQFNPPQNFAQPQIPQQVNSPERQLWQQWQMRQQAMQPAQPTPQWQPPWQNAPPQVQVPNVQQNQNQAWQQQQQFLAYQNTMREVQAATAYDVYGSFPDPLYLYMAANPVPLRYQMPGETFLERFAKNTALGLMEEVCSQAVLAVRQLRLPPRPEPQQSPPREIVIQNTNK